jgi:hypothetical protein
MNFLYTASGLIILSGCADLDAERQYCINWSKGDKPFLKFEALKGKLVQIHIKKVQLIINDHTIRQPVALYFDMVNSCYNDSDLITDSAASEFAIAYYEGKSAASQNLINKFCGVRT